MASGTDGWTFSRWMPGHDLRVIQSAPRWRSNASKRWRSRLRLPTSSCHIKGCREDVLGNLTALGFDPVRRDGQSFEDLCRSWGIHQAVYFVDAGSRVEVDSS